jgi:hypothetical protein
MIQTPPPLTRQTGKDHSQPLPAISFQRTNSIRLLWPFCRYYPKPNLNVAPGFYRTAFTATLTKSDGSESELITDSEIVTRFSSATIGRTITGSPEGSGIFNELSNYAPSPLVIRTSSEATLSQHTLRVYPDKFSRLISPPASTLNTLNAQTAPPKNDIRWALASE